MTRRPAHPQRDLAHLRRRYVDEGTPIDRLAVELHVAPRTLRRMLDEAGIPRRRAGRPPKPIDQTLLRRRYVDDQVGLKALAAELHVSRERLRAELDAASIPIRPAGQEWSHPNLKDQGWLQRQVDRGRSHAEIADLLGCSVHAVSRAIRRHGAQALTL